MKAYEGTEYSGVEKANVTDWEKAETEVKMSSTVPSFTVAINSQSLSTQTEHEGGTSTDDFTRSSAERSPSQSLKVQHRK